MTFGETLFSLRKEKKMSKEDLALSLGVSPSEVERWERNEVFPSDKQLDAIAEVFDFDSEDFSTALKQRAASGERMIYRSDGSHIHIESNPFDPPFTKNEKSRLKKILRKRIIFGAIDILLFLIALTTFLVLGITQNRWHPAWAAFPIAGAIGQLIYVLTFKRKFLIVLIDSVWLTSAAAFLFIGLACNVWHPTWIIFIIDIIFTVAINIIYAYIKRRK